MVKHVKTHSTKRQFKCDICEYGAIEKKCLVAHINSVHRKQFDYVCHLCPYKSVRKTDLASHIRKRHDKVHKFKCDLCEYGASDRKYIRRHQKKEHVSLPEEVTVTPDVGVLLALWPIGGITYY
jgi:KRAB domain-containing zinc finger protein